jgi:hypothetical protein
MAVEVEQVHKLPRAGMVVMVWVATMAETHTVADLPVGVVEVGVAIA